MLDERVRQIERRVRRLQPRRKPPPPRPGHEREFIRRFLVVAREQGVLGGIVPAAAEVLDAGGTVGGAYRAAVEAEVERIAAALRRGAFTLEAPAGANRPFQIDRQ